MRNASLGIALLVAACSQPPPKFTFRGVTAGDPLAVAQRAGLVDRCARQPGANDSGCALKERSLNGTPISLGSADFGNEGFNELFITLPSASFDDSVKDLVAVYGKPCATNSAEVRNGLGISFTNEQVFWCFAGGRLGIERYAYAKDIDTSRLEYPFLDASEIPSTATAKSL